MRDAKERPVFYFDIGSPWCWVAAERIGAALAHAAWEPVLGGAFADPAVDRPSIESHARAEGLGEVRWPASWPFDTLLAMRAATFAKQTGRCVAYSLAAMRQTFLAGRDLSEEDGVLIAAAACELHPRAVLAGIRSRSVIEMLDEASARAKQRGVRELPALAVGNAVCSGSAALTQAITAEVGRR